MFLTDLVKDSKIFIDANIFVYHFCKGSKFNRSWTEFLSRVEASEVQAFTSIMIVQEVTHRLMMLEASAFVDIETKKLPKYLKAHPELVKKLKFHLIVPKAISGLNINLLPVDLSIIARSQEMKTRYGFLSNDALVLQVMQEYGIINLASNDNDFDRVEWLKLYRPYAQEV